MRVMCKPGSVGDLGGQPPRSTRPKAPQGPFKFSFKNDEIGPAFLLPNGRVWFLGLDETAFYNPNTSDWTRGPNLPDKLASYDSPGAILPNGQVIFAAHPLNAYMPTQLLDFSPTSNKITPVVTPTALRRVLQGSEAFPMRMLVLPSGQLLLSDGTSEPWIFTPSGSPKPSWRPTIRRVMNNGEGSFTLDGTQLNGISEGAAYGDDAQMATNYPIVKLTNPRNGSVYYARTFNWSSTGVATGQRPESTDFSLPVDFTPGTYLLSVAANGIASRTVSFRISSLAH